MLKRGVIIVAVMLLLALIAASFPVSKTEATVAPQQFFTNQGPWTLLRTLNDSIIIPSVPTTCSDYVSSPPPGTFNGMMGWYNVSIPLSAYTGKTVYIAFMFNTLDSSYNKFKGWFIQNVRAGGFPYFNLSGMSSFWRKCGSGNGPAWHLDGNVWHYANPITGNYQGNPVYDACDDTWNWGSVVTTPFMVARGSALNFSTEWQIEADIPGYFDRMQVYIASGSNLNRPPACPSPDNGLMPQAINSSSRH